MLARANRVVSAADFKATVRRGKRTHTPHAVIYVAFRDVSEPTRFGFIVGKNAGNAVRRNLVRRRLRAICGELLRESVSVTGCDVVVRALPSVGQLSWASLQAEITDAVRGSVVRR